MSSHKSSSDAATLRITTPASLAVAVRQTAARNKKWYAFFASPSRTDESKVASFHFSMKNPAQFESIRTMAGMVLAEVDSSLLMSRLMKGHKLPQSPSEWKKQVRENKIRPIGSLLRALSNPKSTKTTKRTLVAKPGGTPVKQKPGSAAPLAPKKPDGKQPSKAVEPVESGDPSPPASPPSSSALGFEEVVTTMDNLVMDQHAIDLLNRNLNEIVFQVFLTSAHGFLSNDLAGHIQQFNRDFLDDDELASLHKPGRSIVQDALDHLRNKAIKVESPETIQFLSTVESENNLDSGRAHLWKLPSDSAFDHQLRLKRHFKQCTKCNQERSGMSKVSLLVGHIDSAQRKHLDTDHFKGEKTEADFTFKQLCDILLAFEQSTAKRKQWEDKRPDSDALRRRKPVFEGNHALLLDTKHPPRSNGPSSSRNGKSYAQAAHGRANDWKSQRPNRGGRFAPASSRSPPAGSEKILSVNELRNKVKRVLDSDRLHLFDYLLSCHSANQSSRDMFVRWVHSLRTRFAKFANPASGCRDCNKPFLPRFFCPGCKPELKGKPSKGKIVSFLRSLGKGANGENTGPPRSGNRRAHFTAATHDAPAPSAFNESKSVSFETSHSSFLTTAATHPVTSSRHVFISSSVAAKKKPPRSKHLFILSSDAVSKNKPVENPRFHVVTKLEKSACGDKPLTSSRPSSPSSTDDDDSTLDVPVALLHTDPQDSELIGMPDILDAAPSSDSSNASPPSPDPFECWEGISVSGDVPSDDDRSPKRARVTRDFPASPTVFQALGMQDLSSVQESHFVRLSPTSGGTGLLAVSARDPASESAVTDNCVELKALASGVASNHHKHLPVHNSKLALEQLRRRADEQLLLPSFSDRKWAVQAQEHRLTDMCTHIALTSMWEQSDTHNELVDWVSKLAVLPDDCDVKPPLPLDILRIVLKLSTPPDPSFSGAGKMAFTHDFDVKDAFIAVPIPKLPPMGNVTDILNNAPQCAHAPHCDEPAHNTEQGSLCSLCIHPEDGTLPCDGCLRFDPDFSVRGTRFLSHVSTPQSQPSCHLITSSALSSSSSSVALGVSAPTHPSPASTSKVRWIVDSGASNMFTHDLSLLSNVRPTSVAVSGSNSSSSPMRATHAGRFGIFPHVLFVPSIAQNLMSVSILRKLGFHVDFMKLRISRGHIVWPIRHHHDCNLFTVLLPRRPVDAFAHSNQTSFVSWNLAEVFHRRFNHISKRALLRVFKVHGITVPRKHLRRMRLCSGCALSKAINVPVPSSLPKRNVKDSNVKPKPVKFKKPFEHISIDTCGPISPQSHNGSVYYHVFVCKVTGFIHAACTKLKSDVADAFIAFHRQTVVNGGFRTKVVRTDGALELTRSRLRRYVVLNGIHSEVTPPFSSFANAHAERAIRTVTTGVRTLLVDSGVAPKFWGYAVNAFTHVHNRLPKVGKRSPMHIITGRLPKIDYFRIFGCRCHVFTHPQERDKSDRLQPTSRVGTFLGYVPGSKSFFVLIGRTVLRRRSLHFDENIDDMILKCKQRHPQPGVASSPVPIRVPVEGASSIELSGSTPPTQLASSIPVLTNDPPPSTNAGDAGDTSFNPHEDTMSSESKHDASTSIRRKLRMNRGVPGLKMGFHDESHLVASVEPSSTLIPTDTTHSPDNFWTTACREHALTTAKAADFVTPRTHREAVNGPQGSEWARSINRELSSLKTKGVWDVVPATKQKPIGMKWVFKVKQDELGNVLKFKSRLVCQGFRQRHGIDFFDTYAPVANYSSIRAMLAFAAFHDLEMHQMDVDVAFLNGVLKERIYCRPPPGVTVPHGHFLLLRRALYGTKQAARVWWQNIDDTFLKSLGMSKSPADPCVYFRPLSKSKQKGKNGILIIILFVDDIIILSDKMSTINHTKSTLKSVYSMTDQGELRWCLGMRVLRNRSQRIVTLDQQRYVLDILERFGMSKCNPVSVPMAPELRLSSADCPSSPSEINDLRSYHSEYRAIVGSLSYAALSSRPDIATATIICAKFAHNPGRKHLLAAKKIMRYLRGTVDTCITFGGSSFNDPNHEHAFPPEHDPRSKENMHLRLFGFSDSNWAGDLDKRRSTSGHIFFKNGGPISWKSKMQTCIAQSSAEAEYIAASEASKEAVWLRTLLASVTCKPFIEPTLIKVDNQAAISIINNPVCSSKTKHIEMRYHYVRHLKSRGIIDVTHVPTKHNVSDILTKPLAKMTHNFLRDICMAPQPVVESG